MLKQGGQPTAALKIVPLSEVYFPFVTSSDTPKADLQQKETDAALTKARCAMEVSVEQLRLMEEDYETTLLNAMRHMLHGQLTLHSNGIETFTEAMNELPETARLVPRLPRPEGSENQ